MMSHQKRIELKNKKRIVIKIGSSSLTHQESGDLNLLKIERLVRIISDLKGQGKEVVLVSSGAIAAGRQALHETGRPDSLARKQAYAAVGQARLMMVYQKLFAEYNQTAAQVLLTKDTMVNDSSRYNAQNTFEELLKLPGVGRKSANLIMGDVFGKPAIVTDTHCIRLSNRLGLVENCKDPKKVEMALWKLIPPEEGSDFCHRLVYHGRDVCTARTKPFCGKCCVKDICARNGVED